MSAGDYLADVALLAVALGPLAAGAGAVARRALPGATRAVAALASAVLWLAGLLAVAQLLGAVGALSRWPLVAACAAVGAGTWLACRRSRSVEDLAAHSRTDPPLASTSARPSRVAVAVAAAAVLAVTAQWVSFTVEVTHQGMIHTDSRWYHMSFAARFAQEGSITGLHHTLTEPLLAGDPEKSDQSAIGTPTFYPANASLLHAAGMVVTDSDWPSPFLNLGWLALALLAAWCAGAPRGVGPHAVVAVATLMATHTMATTQPGEGLNDAAVVALVLAAAALILAVPGRRASLALAGAAVGIAVGMKLSALAPALGLAVAAVALARRGERRGAAVAVGAPLAAMGALWYLRNLFATGNPVPYLDSLGPIGLPSPDLPLTDRYSFTLLHYATRTELWEDWFGSSLESGLGDAWPLLVALAAGGAVAGLARRHPPELRAVAAAAAVALLAYPATPLTGGGPDGRPVLFFYTLRYLIPGLALGLVLVPMLVRGRWRDLTLAVLAVLMLVTLTSGVWLPARRGEALAATAVLPIGALALHAVRARPLARRAAAAVLAAAALAAVLGRADSYLDDGFTREGAFLGRQYAAARDISGARIAIAGFYEQYPLHGRDLSNRVQYVGREGDHGAFHPIASCAEWRRAVDAGDYDYVVTAAWEAQHPDLVRGRGGAVAEPPMAGWTRSSPAAREIVRDREGSALFRLHGPLGAETC